MGLGDYVGTIVGTAVAGPVGGLVGYQADVTGKASDAEKEAAANAANVARETADKQIALQKENLAFQKDIYAQQQANIAPWLEAGRQGLKDLAGMEDFRYDFKTQQWVAPEFDTVSKFASPTYQAVDRFAAPEFDATKVNLYNDPGYQFRLAQGVKAMDRSASARGGLFGGAQQKALTEYGQGMGSQEFGNAYSRALADWQRRYGIEADRYGRDLALSESRYAREYGAEADRYGRDYSAAENAYRRLYGAESDRYNRAYGAEADAYNRARTAYDLKYNRYANLAGVGQSATGQANAAAGNMGSVYGMNTNQMAQIYGNQGNALSNMYLQQGQADANKYATYGNIAGGILNTGLQVGGMAMGAPAVPK